jgi:hypothetical protein
MVFSIMIGVISKPEEREVVEEFFQLFKTPWEFFDSDHCYDVVIATVETPPEVGSSLFVVFGTNKSALDKYELADPGIQGSEVFIQWGETSLPIYGKAITFRNPNQPILFCNKSKRTIGYETHRGGQRILRFGYDLFKEVLFLLSEGQPPQNALIPTLDLHVEMLRNWIVETGIPLVEIPPVPEGYRFIVCLTHDVDFVSIRDHLFDHSMLGFLYRATLGSLLNVLRAKVPLANLLANLKAVCSLPLVILGICHDPWDQFDRYLELEWDVRSTYFFIPHKNQAGQGFSKGSLRRRATKYDVDDVEDVIQKLVRHGCEIGAHGIDAWHSVEKGIQELQRIRGKAVSQNEIGVRIHWLCFNEETPNVLDQAGYSYDSSVGYNEAVGYKAGTAQVFKPIGARNLLEIPLHIQDTALFGDGRMNASEAHAGELCQQIIDHVSRQNGLLTVLWHQRSLGPERLWGDFYERLIKRLQEEKAWFGTATEIAEWFRARRRILFEDNNVEIGGVNTGAVPTLNQWTPPFMLRRSNWNSKKLAGIPYAEAGECLKSIASPEIDG